MVKQTRAFDSKTFEGVAEESIHEEHYEKILPTPLRRLLRVEANDSAVEGALLTMMLGKRWVIQAGVGSGWNRISQRAPRISLRRLETF